MTEPLRGFRNRGVVAVVLGMMLFAGVAVAADEAATPAAAPAARELATAGENPPLPVPPKQAVQNPVKKKKPIRRGELGEKPTVEQVLEIVEEGGSLSGMDLRGLNLVGFNLRGAKLAGASLAGANLERADLQEANLERADLGKANMKRATLRYANVNGASLEETNLEGAIWLDGSLCAKGSVGSCRER